jgi:hypothetical protein
MTYEDAGRDDQDTAETFDEEMTEGDKPALEGAAFEDLPDVYDVTRARGDDSDIVDLDEADFDEEAVDDEDFEEEDEVGDQETYAEGDLEDDPDEIDRIAARGRDEVELEYKPDVDDRRGARSGAGGYEARGELDEDDLDELGYGADEEEEQAEVEDAVPAGAEAKSFATPAQARRPREDADTPHTRPADEPLKHGRVHDHLGAHHLTAGEHRQEALLDEAIDETFPASDPIAPKHIT